MTKLNMDWLAAVWVLSVLSLLCLPDFLLLSWQRAGAGILLLFACAGFFFIRRNRRTAALFGKLLILTLCTAYAHYQPLQLLALADNTADSAYKANTEFVIEEIIHQQHYQALVIRAKLHPDWPEQRIYAQWKGDEMMRIGERWRAELQPLPLSARLNHGGFDRQPWYFAKGISARVTIKSAVRISADFSLRQRWLNAAVRQTDGLKRQGLLLALGFGERARLKAEDWQVYRRTNTAHLIAISGLHVGLAAAGGFMLMRGLQFLLPTVRISPSLPVLGGLAFAYGYAALAGFTIPTLRALAALIMLYALRLGRLYCTPWRLFIRVIAVLLLCDPLMVLSVSFWLSAGAVACLILWYQVFPLGLLEWRGKPLSTKVRRISALLHLQLGLLWLFTPIQLAVFNGFSVYGFWANLIAVPLFSFVLVPLVLFAVLTRGALSSWQTADFLAATIEWILSGLQNGWIDVSEKTTLVLTALLLAAFLFLIRRLYRKPPQGHELWRQTRKGFSLKAERRLSSRWQRRFVCCGILGIAYCILALVRPYIDRPNWRLETLDVGQGLATMIVKNGRAVLYDTGAGWGGGSMAKTEIIPYLRRRGIWPERLILSHDDNDHAGGAADMLAQYPMLELMTPSRQNYPKTDRTFCRRGLQWQWQGLNFRVLSPPEPVERAGNTDSCVVLIDDGQYRVLLTGDADIAAENRFAPGLGGVDVLQAGHHGSKTSTGSRLVSEIRPAISLISSGRRNRWRFPHREVLQRLHRAQSDVYNTAVSGQISLLFRDDGIDVYTARSGFSPWYRRRIGTVE